jgi:quercetin dioxygenase-like cupin family protein
MARSGDVLDVPSLGITIEFRRTGEETGGELVEFDVVGRPKGFVTVPHVHPRQSERHEVIEGSLLIKTGGLERLLGPGEVVETPAGTPHTHRAGGDGPSRVRVQVRPPGRFEAWMERIAAIEREGDMLPAGWPKPVAGARLLLDFEGEAHGVAPPLSLQQAAARGVLRARDFVAQRRR